VKIHTFQEGAVNAIAVFKNQLYVGTYKNGSIYRSSDGVNWQKVFDGNTYVPAFGGVYAFEQYDNGSGMALYAGIGSYSLASGQTAVILKSYDGSTWNVVYNGSVGGERYIQALEVYNNSLYAVSLASGVSYIIYSSDDKTWWNELTEATGIFSLKQFKDKLYAGAMGDAIAWRNNTVGWTGNTGYGVNVVYALEPFENKMHAAGTKIVNISDDASSWTDSLTPSDTNVRGLFNDAHNQTFYALTAQYKGLIYGKPQNNVWTLSFNSTLNYSRAAELFNATGDWRLYVGIAGPKWNTVNGGQAYLYRSTFTS
jgi:hypothetical protein